MNWSGVEKEHDADHNYGRDHCHKNYVSEPFSERREIECPERESVCGIKKRVLQHECTRTDQKRIYRYPKAEKWKTVCAFEICEMFNIFHGDKDTVSSVCRQGTT